MKATKAQREAVRKLAELARTAQDLLLEVDPTPASAYHVAYHAAETLAKCVEDLRIASLTPEEYRAELEDKA